LFDGENDAKVMMWILRPAGGYDGLHADVANKNEGAESTFGAGINPSQAFRDQTIST